MTTIPVASSAINSFVPSLSLSNVVVPLGSQLLAGLTPVILPGVAISVPTGSLASTYYAPSTIINLEPAWLSNPAISELPISGFDLISGFFIMPVTRIELTGFRPTSLINALPIFDGTQTVISQYANSPILTSIIQSFNDAMDQTNDFNIFINLVWQIDTAVGYGLDVWGRIVGVTRYLFIGDTDFLGFKGYNGEFSGDVFFDPYIASTGMSPFYTGEQLTTNVALTDDAFRTLILAKAYANITDGSAASINKIMLLLFGGSGGNAYIADNNDMSVTYTFDFVPTPVQLSILFQTGVLPSPTGVQINYSYM